MIWLFELSAALLVIAFLIGPVCRLLAPSWAGIEVPRLKRAKSDRSPTVRRP